jgi:hypothetical protein
LGARRKQPECGVMQRTLKDIGKYRDWRIFAFAGVLGFAVTLAAMEITMPIRRR